MSSYYFFCVVWMLYGVVFYGIIFKNSKENNYETLL